MRRWLRLTACLLCITVGTFGCGGSHEETVGGVKIPIPDGMTKSQEAGIELSLPGFGGAQAAYQGKVDPDKVIAFYQKRNAGPGMAAQPRIAVSGGHANLCKGEHNSHRHSRKHR